MHVTAMCLYGTKTELLRGNAIQVEDVLFLCKVLHYETFRDDTFRFIQSKQDSK